MNPENPGSAQDLYTAIPIPGRRAGDRPEIVTATPDGIHLTDRAAFGLHWIANDPPGLVQALMIRGFVSGRTSRVKSRILTPAERDTAIDHVAAKVLVTRRSERWREAVSTALAGPWCDPLWQTGQLPATALGALKAEARALHRQLTPVWQRRTRHGRVLSLDADLGALSLYDLVAAEVDLLAHTTDGVFEDERLNRVLRGLDPAEQRVVCAYAAREGTTWTEAAAHAGAGAPEAFGERVRRKVNRLVAEQRRRAAQRRPGSPAACPGPTPPCAGPELPVPSM